MKKQNYDITPGDDKFLPVPDQAQPDHKLLRLHIDDATHKRNFGTKDERRASDSIVASLALALVILAATAVIVHCTS